VLTGGVKAQEVLRGYHGDIILERRAPGWTLGNDNHEAIHYYTAVCDSRQDVVADIEKFAERYLSKTALAECVDELRRLL
jgi:hypothetical protein